MSIRIAFALLALLASTTKAAPIDVPLPRELAEKRELARADAHPPPRALSTERQLRHAKRKLAFSLESFQLQVNSTIAALQNASAGQIHPKNARYALQIANGIDALLGAYETVLEKEAEPYVETLGDAADVDGIALHDAVKGVVQGLSAALVSIDDFNQEPTIDQGVNSSTEILNVINENTEVVVPLVLDVATKFFGCA